MLNQINEITTEHITALFGIFILSAFFSTVDPMILGSQFEPLFDSIKTMSIMSILLILAVPSYGLYKFITNILSY